MITGNLLFNNNKELDRRDISKWEKIMRIITNQNHFYGMNIMQFLIDKNKMFFFNIEHPLACASYNFTENKSQVNTDPYACKDIYMKCEANLHLWIAIGDFNDLLETSIKRIMIPHTDIEDYLRMKYKTHNTMPYEGE